MNDTQHATLLFVDDEPNILSALRRLFRPLGYRILTAESGDEALELLAQHPVDLVVSDMRMPGMDGATLLTRIREGWPDIMRILLTGYADLNSSIAAINQGEIYRYLVKPWDDQDLVLTIRDALQRKQLVEENRRLTYLTQQQNDALREANTLLEHKVAERTAELSKTMDSLHHSHQQLKRAYMATIQAITGLVGLRGDGIGEHSRRVAEIARQLAQRMKLGDNEVQDIVLAGLLHDIGKIGMPPALVTRPYLHLSQSERIEVEAHPVRAQNLLVAIAPLKNAATIIRSHHEQFDGKGYPDQLAGIRIPLGARILAVVNDFDRLQHGTLTQSKMTPQEARDFLLENRGKRYDPTVIDAFEGWLQHTYRDVIDDISLSPSALKVGMIVARDLIHRDGYLLLAHGYSLDEAVIQELQRMEQSEGIKLTLYIRNSH